MRLVSLNVGRPQLLMRGGRSFSTAINRKPVDQPIHLDTLGFHGDRVSNRDAHGGPHRAVCVYPHEHYAHWRSLFGLPFEIPGFGENLTTEGLLEREVAIGDRFRIGDAVIEVSQPREPCRTLAAKHMLPELPKHIHTEAYCGFYVRVIRSGLVPPDTTIERLDHSHPELTIERTLHAAAGRLNDELLLRSLTAAPQLSPGYREKVERRLAGVGEPLD